jgi:TetR/AcrR family transcriptional regulator, mexJK operon transcriptional repressor
LYVTAPLSQSRREARKADRRRAILDVAERSFLERGYAATSMSTIAAELGGSKTTLWSYFPSKEELFAAVLDAQIAHFQQALDEALLQNDGTRAALARFGRILLTKITSPRSMALQRLIVAEAERFPSIGIAFASRGPDRARDRLARWVAEEMAAGRLREGDAALAARQFFALCQAGCYLAKLWRAFAGMIDIDAEIDAAVETFMAAWGPARA